MTRMQCEKSRCLVLNKNDHLSVRYMASDVKGKETKYIIQDLNATDDSSKGKII